MPVVGKLLLVGSRLQRTLAWQALAEYRPVNRTRGAARTNQVLAAESTINNEVPVFPPDRSDVMLHYARCGTPQQEFVELVTTYRVLRRTQSLRQHAPVHLQFVERHETQRIVVGFEF